MYYSSAELYAVSQSCTLRGVGKIQCVGPSHALPNTIRRYSRLKISCVRQKICFERATAFFLSLLLKKGGEGRGEEAFFINFPSLRLSPRSFLAGRERQNTGGVLRAEHNWSQIRAPGPAAVRRSGIANALNFDSDSSFPLAALAQNATLRSLTLDF